MAKLIILVVASLCATLCVAKSMYMGRLLTLDESEKLPAFDESEIVSTDYARANFVNTRVYMAGQGDFYPYAIGQKSTSELGSSSDRWDVKSWDVRKHNSGIQFFGLYNGNDETLVNQLRAHLLTDIANRVKDVLIVLDKQASYPEPQPQVLELLKHEANKRITQTFVDLDKSIGGSNGGASASASVFIVTKKYLVSANLGQGKIVAYDDQGNSQELSVASGSESALNLFGSGQLAVNILERGFDINLDPSKSNFQLPKYQFAIVEGPSVAEHLSVEEAIAISKSQMSLDNLGYDQKFNASATQLLEETVKKAPVDQKDHSVIFVGLDISH